MSEAEIGFHFSLLFCNFTPINRNLNHDKNNVMTQIALATVSTEERNQFILDCQESFGVVTL